MVFDPQEIMDHGGLFGVDREEWENSPQFPEKVMERQEHQQEREQAFLSHNRDCFAIYQVTRDDPQNVRFMNLDWLKSQMCIRDRLYSGDAADFVEDKILPNAEKTMAVLTDQEQAAARLLLSALIGFLAAEAPMDEQMCIRDRYP